jgi:putative two-component system response regulator
LACILIVDDEELNTAAYSRALTAFGHDCTEAHDGMSARTFLAAYSYDVVLLDVNMPSESGIELIEHVRSASPDSAVMMVTGVDDAQLASIATQLGAHGYMVKPVRSNELAVNVANALIRRQLEAENRRVLDTLESTVAERTAQLREALSELEESRTEIAASQAEVILRLARVVEFRDEDTGRHVERMSRWCALVAIELGWTSEEALNLRLASQLHDIGKVAVPDSVLRKPGRLSRDEMELMRTHADAGYRMLAGSSSELLRLAATIARTHHERWDGSGYPDGLRGEATPVSGRMAAVADVFDALTSNRVYRPVLLGESALGLMTGELNFLFDPDTLAALTTVVRRASSAAADAIALNAPVR